MRGRNAARAGFTLTEMLVAVAVLAALAAVALPMLSTLEPRRVELAAAELVQALRFARSESERTRIPHGVRVDPATESARLFRLDTGSVPPVPDFTVHHPVHLGLYVLDFDGDPSTAGVAIDSVTVNFAAACGEPRDIAFDERGTPLCADPFGIEVTDGQIALREGAVVRQIDIAGVTGRVVLQ